MNRSRKEVIWSRAVLDRICNAAAAASAAAAARRKSRTLSHERPMKIRRKVRRKLCVESVDLTLDTNEPIAPLARKKKDGKIVLSKEKGNIALPNVIVHVDNMQTEMRNFRKLNRNEQTRHPGFFEIVDFVYKLEFESVVCLKPNTIFEWLKKTNEIYATEVVI